MPLVTRQACGLVVLAGLLSCSSGGTTTTPPVVATILLSQSSATLAPGAAVQLTATALDAGGAAISGSTISWSTNSAAVATVTSTGLVAAVASGSATITATSGGKSAQATITVTIPVATVTLSQSAATLVPAATLQITATPKDASGATVSGQTVAWSTNGATVATVSSTGLVTAVAIGTATISATVSGKSADAVITVQAGAVIGAAGGTVVSADGNATVIIPAGALTSSTSISISPTAAAPTTPVPVGQGYDLSPSGTQFTVPVTIKLKYNPALVPTGHSAGALQMRTQVSTAWNALSAVVIDSVAHTVTATTTHFSTYIITDPRLALGIRDGDVFSAVKASNTSIRVCVNDTKRVVILFYDQSLLSFTPSLSWGPGTSFAGAAGELPSAGGVGVGITISGGPVAGGPSDLIVTVNGESVTLHITVILCMEPAITYIRDVSGLDNAYLYLNRGNSALTTDNGTSKTSTSPNGLGAVGVFNGGSSRSVNYYGVGYSGLRASLMTPVYTTPNFLEAFNWVTPTQYEFGESSGITGLWQLFRMNTDGSARTPFAAAATAGGSARQAYLAGNGFTYFGFALPPGSGPTQLYRVDANGGNMTALFPVSGWASTPTVSQDGQWLAMSVLNPGFTAAPILLYDLGNPQAAPIAVSPATGGAFFPAFCGNGVVYYTYSANGFSGPWTLYRWDIVSRIATPAAFVASGSLPEGASIQPQKGMTDRSCPK